MAYTEFYVQTTGSNLNAGSTTANAASLTYASGNWVAATGVFTVASGNPTSDGVAVGDFASVYADGATATAFVGRVTARDATTITVSLTAVSGTPPADGTGNRTLKIGGAWAGPSGAVIFPFGFVVGTMTNAAGDPTRVNVKNGVTYSYSSALTSPNLGALTWQGYTSTPGDGGRAVFDVSTNAITGMTIAGSRNAVIDFEFTSSASSGTQPGINASGDALIFRNKVTGFRGAGIAASALAVIGENEISGCNTANTTNIGGITLSSGSHVTILRNYIHDNTGSNASGIVTSPTADATAQIIGNVIKSNGRFGIFLQNRSGVYVIIGNDFYNNTLDHIRTSTSTNGSLVYMENNNFIAGAAWGMLRSDAFTDHLFYLTNNGFGSGTAANSSGTTSGIPTVLDSVQYPADEMPWVSPATGDFRIKLAQARNAGRGTFLGLTNAAGYPDIGAVQSKKTRASGAVSA